MEWYVRDYPEDCDRVAQVAAELGYDWTIEQAGNFWEEYSGDMCASWMIVPDEKELKKIIEDHLLFIERKRMWRRKNEDRY